MRDGYEDVEDEDAYEQYVAFVEDSTFADGIVEYRTEGQGIEEAFSNAQEAFPSGVVRSVHHAVNVEEIDDQIIRARRKRKASHKRAIDTLHAVGFSDELIANLVKAKTLE